MPNDSHPRNNTNLLLLLSSFFQQTTGLFRACMDAIRKSHTLGQSLRNASIAAGLLTDKNCYAEMLGQFYVVTAALEQRIDELVELEQQQQQQHQHENKSIEHENKSIDDNTNAQAE